MRSYNLEKLFNELPKNALEKIFCNKNVQIYKVLSDNYLEKIIRILVNPILLSPTEEQFPVPIDTPSDMILWNELECKIQNNSTVYILENKCIYLLDSPETWNMYIAKWKNRRP